MESKVEGMSVFKLQSVKLSAGVPVYPRDLDSSSYTAPPNLLLTSPSL